MAASACSKLTYMLYLSFFHITETDDNSEAIMFDHVNSISDLTNLEAFEMGMLRLTEQHGVPRDVQRQINALINEKLLGKIETTSVLQGT